MMGYASSEPKVGEVPVYDERDAQKSIYQMLNKMTILLSEDIEVLNQFFDNFLGQPGRNIERRDAKCIMDHMEMNMDLAMEVHEGLLALKSKLGLEG